MSPKLRVGRLFLTESEFRVLSEGPDGIKLSGVENNGVKGISWLRALQQDFVGLYGSLAPVTFGNKSPWDGFYMVSKSDAQLTDWTSIGLCEWDLELSRVGYPNDLDLESRLSGPASLQNDHAAVGERTNTPPVGHTAYFSGATSPAIVTRTGTEGGLKVYRSLPTALNTRWSCSPANYILGRCRFIDSNGYERSGVNQQNALTGWQMNSSILRVTGLAAGGNIEVACWDGTQWDTKNWWLRMNGANLGLPKSVNVIRNDFETVIVRLLYDVAPSGRLTVDLTMRRGHRQVDVYMKSSASATLGILAATAEAGTSSTGFLTATANDAQGNKYTIGSSKTFTADTANGGISKAATLTFDGYIGSVLGGTGAVAGDAASVIFSQFIGAPSERVIGVRV